MSVNVYINCKIVGDGEFQITYPFYPTTAAYSPPVADRPVEDEHQDARSRDVETRREDRVLPIGSSTLVPGLSLPLHS